MAKGAVEVRHPVVRKALAAFDDDADAFRAALHPGIEWYPIEPARSLCNVAAVKRGLLVHAEAGVIASVTRQARLPERKTLMVRARRRRRSPWLPARALPRLL